MSVVSPTFLSRIQAPPPPRRIRPPADRPMKKALRTQISPKLSGREIRQWFLNVTLNNVGYANYSPVYYSISLFDCTLEMASGSSSKFYLKIMYRSIPSLTISPVKLLRNFFERANSPPLWHKESAKPIPLGPKNRAKTPPPRQLFSKLQQEKHKT